MAKPLGLAVVLVVLAATTYWLQYSKKPKDEAAEADAKKVLRLKDSTVARLELRGSSQKPENAKKLPLSVSLACESLAEHLCKPDDASKWRMDEPLKTKADDATVNSLLKNFGNLVSTDAIDLGSETPEKRAQLLKDYGLDDAARKNPRTRRITVARDGGERTTVYFGEKHPIGDNVFALVQTGDAANESKVFVVPAWQLSVFDQKTSYFRDKNLFGLNEKDVTAFTLATAKKLKGKLEAKLAADGWGLRNGATEAEGDMDAVDGMLSGVVHLAAKDVVSESKSSAEAKAALAGAKNTYDLRFTAKGAEKRLRLFEKKKDPNATVVTVYATVDDQDPLYELDSYSVEKIEKTFDELRFGKLIGVADRYAITAIEIDTHGAETFKQRAEKDAGGVWKIGGAEAARGSIEGILDRLTSKIVVAYTGAAPAGDFTKMTFLKKADGKETPVAEIEFWSSKGRLYARNLRTPKKEIVELAPDFEKSLPFKAATLTAAPKGSEKK